MTGAAVPEVLPHWQVHAGQGPYLLMLHGLLSSRAQWQDNLAALGSVCTPVTVELFGHHDSPAPADPGCYEPDYYVACLEQIRQALGAERWFVLGYSLGAGITIRYTLTFPDRVIGHLFTNSTSGFADADQVEAWRASAPRTAERIREGGHDAMAAIPVHPRYGRNLPAHVRAQLVADAEQHDPHGIASTLAITNPWCRCASGSTPTPGRPACCSAPGRNASSPTGSTLSSTCPTSPSPPWTPVMA